MRDSLDNTIDILQELVSYKSVSGEPTDEIVGYIVSYLSGMGIEASLSYDADGQRANVFATIGPDIEGGVVLSGHTDVVPVSGQNWSSDPFVLTKRDNRLYGRGSVDMKGFIACVLGSVPLFKAAKLTKPIHLAFSYDEETGGFGMPVLLDSLEKHQIRPSIVIVGEPTQMELITGHKGGYELRTEITGHAVHSCDPTLGVNAIAVAGKLISKIEQVGQQLAAKPFPDSPYQPPFSTLNVGLIEGGTASNATAGWCTFNWELRPMPGEDGEAILTEIKDYAKLELLPSMHAVHPKTDIRIETLATVPALDDRNATLAAEFVSQVTGLNSRNVVSFGTDAGYFSNAGMSTVVFGPGDINRAHKADEYIEIDELVQGLQFLKKVSQRLCG